MRKSIVLPLLLLLAPLLRGQVIFEGFAHDGIYRVYELHFPPGWVAGDSLPLLMDFHYLGADGRDEDSLTRFYPVGDAEGFIVCHPWGYFTDWNVGQQQPYHSGTRDVEWVDELIDTINVGYGIDMDRVYAVGMGQGGFFVHRLACELSDRIAAFAAVGANIADSTKFYCNNTRPAPMMMVQGTTDSVIFYHTGLPGVWGSVPQMVDFWKTRNNCSGNEITQNLPNNNPNDNSSIISHRWLCDQSSEVLLYEVVGGGFAWPGANRDLGSGGVRNMDINCSRHVWDFLSRYTLTTFTPADAPEPASEQSLIAFPNPASAQVSIEITGNKLQEMNVLDMQGRVVPVECKRLGNRIQIDCRELPDGLYLLHVNGRIGRLLVQH